uniref:PNPLA domain-containing protein n=1 Tax=Caenorhabditis tropicalis TaxID=1561998 RepID=A0A1I7TK85_9PELO
MFRNRSKSNDRSKRNNSKDRSRADPITFDYDLSNVCNHLEALMNAARYGNTDLLYKLYIHHIDLKMTDETGNTAMHVAVMVEKYVKKSQILVREIFRTVNKEQIREDFNSLDNPPSPTPDGFIDVDSYYNDILVREKKKWKNEERVLLSLDGGGIRAVITVQMLIHIDHMLDGKLVEKIDDMAGTSCGGVITLLLSTNNRNIEETRKLLLEMRERVFIRGFDKSVPKYSSTGMEYIARHVTTWEDSKMSVIKRHRAMVTVADTRMVPPQLLLFRSYCPEMPEEACEHYKFLDPSKVELWKALRCTTAAPYFFESFNGLSDGGLIANNPTLALVSDFLLTNKLEKSFAKTPEEREKKGNWKIGCVISLGTGVFPTEKIDGIDLVVAHAKNPIQFAKSCYKVFASTRNLLHVLVKECTASNGQPVKYAREWCHSLNTPYFRFSPHLSQGISLDEIDLEKVIQVMWETELYVASHRNQFVKLVNFLATKPKRDGFDNPSNSQDSESIEQSEMTETTTTTITATTTTETS